MQSPQKRRTITPHKKKRIKEMLVCLWNSCDEGYTEKWDCSSAEGKKGFIAMQQVIEEISKELEIKL